MNNTVENGADMGGMLVNIQNLTKTYDGVNTVLGGIGLSLPQGEIVGLLGPNGCGKTTLIKIMAGLMHGYTGQVLIDGHAPDEYTKSIVSYLPEKTYLAPWMTTQYAIRYFADFYADFDAQKAHEMAAQFGLQPKMPVKSMSKGMQEKLQLILVMCRRAKLYLLDEPLGGIDPAARSTILDIILNNYADNASVMLSTHLIHDVERIFDGVIMLGYGRILLSDRVDNIRANTGKSIEDNFREVFAYVQ